MVLRRLVLSCVLAAAWAVVACAPAGAAFRAPCVIGGGAGPTCTWWDAKVTFVADGDTVDATIKGVGTRAIRFTGINAMELTRYSKYASRRRGACHGLEATALVDRYVRAAHGRVRLAAQRVSSASGHRLRRSVWVRSGGRWVDLARQEVSRGLALWLPNPVESAHDADYSRLAQRAVIARRGLYDPDACGAGPDDDAALSVVVNWDADGSDEVDVNGEWAEIRNASSRAVSLAGWWFRDSWLRYDGNVPGFPFPAAARIPAGGSVRLYSGCGTGNGVTVFYWCQEGSVYENSGDGGYLFDPQGDVRASFIFPCRVACADPLAGRVRVAVHAATPEVIGVTNVSGTPVDLADHVLKLRNRDGGPGSYVFGYLFEPGSVVAPGATMRLVPQGSGSEDTALVRHADRPQYALADGGGAVELRTAADTLTTCASWGSGAC